VSVPLECRSVTKRLRSGQTELVVLRDVTLRVEGGEIVAVVGPSGSGKSTLLGLLAGLDRADEGQVLVGGQELGVLDEDALALLRRDRMGFVFQSFQLLSNLTARENVLLPLEMTGAGDAPARADAMLARVGLAERAHHYPSQLSGGEQQRVALARAYAPRPAVLLADEPTGNLDADSGRAALDLLVALQREEGTTLVLVTHDPQVAARAERIVTLRAGEIVADERRGPRAAAPGGGEPGAGGSHGGGDEAAPGAAPASPGETRPHAAADDAGAARPRDVEARP